MAADPICVPSPKAAELGSTPLSANSSRIASLAQSISPNTSIIPQANVRASTTPVAAPARRSPSLPRGRSSQTVSQPKRLHSSRSCPCGWPPLSTLAVPLLLLGGHPWACRCYFLPPRGAAHRQELHRQAVEHPGSSCFRMLRTPLADLLGQRRLTGVGWRSCSR